ncbi:hypothetical protein QTG54_008082 [Skeletonema marinoi]|uniref:Uncharacterized protein n=1 Tax=Skeletonema marinoi TaxID=267567 RepID=A0AAD8Y9N4_9STRA|nr:hypothetical protein QTG54_008082 [Skeletonema marinoi]
MKPTIRMSRHDPSGPMSARWGASPPIAAKTLYGVYAAKQFDPIHQADQLESFFVIFTGVEFLGSFVGALISIVIADLLVDPHPQICARKVNETDLWADPSCALVEDLKALLPAPGFSKTKESKGGSIPDAAVDSMVQIILLFPVFLLIMPLNVAFTQAIVVNITTCAYMTGVGPLKGPLLVSTSLLFIGLWAFMIKRFLSPFLQKKQSTLIKKIFSGLFGTFMSGGVAFHISAMNEIAFTVAPAELKMLGTATYHAFRLPNIIGAILYNACSHWFRDPDGNKIRSIQQYVNANSVYFTYLMLGLCMFNALVMLLPPVKRWISRVEENSIANNEARAQDGA